MKKGPLGPFFAMEELQRLLDRVTTAREEVQQKMQIARIGGPVNEATYRWLAGQNRAFGHVQLWLHEELSKRNGKQ